MWRHFLISVLGQAGADTLQKAVRDLPELEPIVVPRAVFAWLDVLQEATFKGNIPGTETPLSFAKSERGYNGYVYFGPEKYDFAGVPLSHVGAAIAMAIGAATEAKLENDRLPQLGKSIDLLVKSGIAQKLKKNKGAPKAPSAEGAGPGPAHAQQPPVPPSPPTLVQPEKPGERAGTDQRSRIKSKAKIVLPGAGMKKPAANKMPSSKGLPKPKEGESSKGSKKTLKVGKSMAYATCGTCGGKHFTKQAYSGCMCYEDLAKNTTTKATQNGFEISFGTDWDEDSIAALLRSMVGE